MPRGKQSTRPLYSANVAFDGKKGEQEAEPQTQVLSRLRDKVDQASSLTTELDLEQQNATNEFEAGLQA